MYLLERLPCYGKVFSGPAVRIILPHRSALKERFPLSIKTTLTTEGKEGKKSVFLGVHPWAKPFLRGEREKISFRSCADCAMLERHDALRTVGGFADF